MTDYTKKALATDAKLRAKGGSVTLRRVVLGDDDPDTGKPISTSTDYTAAGVKLNYSADRIDGTLVQMGDQELYLSPLQMTGERLPEPAVSDQIWIGGARYAIKAVGKVEPVDTPVLYMLQIRGG